ncbi:ArgE/DapE family deacylase [Bifidobacterium bombi]|uniref:Succinyl-diaminopimelate desuccinylase n=1 Tax=Bifidobacterium bombi DSM 19703 TaxID=1341695 RepID=A0A080N2H0_9BIFI|nr:ArgE/DapE family deacylase [Bifidobacterium bombi]KFF31172.1 succinyl-diaminopimelate desuccinylase [Bifidobacterium bombi DSM 19703]
MTEQYDDEKSQMDLLGKFVGFHTENGNEKVLADFIHGIFEEAGVNSTVLPFKDDPKRANLVAEVGGGDPVLVLTGHMDTVSAQQEGWQTDPFEVVEKDDMIYGRGVTDMKAGLAAMVITMLRLKRVESRLHGTVRFLATAGEEINMPGAELLHDGGYMKDAEALLIGEPSAYSPVYATKGELNLEITMHGKSAHSSMPQLGANAVEGLVTFLYRLTDRIRRQTAGITNPDLGETVFNIDVIKGGSQVNTIPESARAEINMRVIPDLSNKEILKMVDDEVAKFNAENKAQVSYEVTMDIVPIVGAKESRLGDIVREVGDESLQAQGKDDRIKFVGVSGGTDASRLFVDKPVGQPCLAFGPGNFTMHCVNESLPKHMYFEFIDMYERITKKYMGVE